MNSDPEAQDRDIDNFAVIISLFIATYYYYLSLALTNLQIQI